MLDSIRNRVRAWLYPDLEAELFRLTMSQEAMFDILAIRLPMSPVIYNEAVANCESLQSDINAGKICLKDRAASLIEVLKRKGIIVPREKNK